MGEPDSKQWDRIHELIERLEQLPLSRVRHQLGEGCGTLEDPLVISYARFHFSLSQEPGFRFRPGDSVGNYVLEERLGAGGMGIVHGAWQQAPRRGVALKMIHPTLSSAIFRERFRQEIEAQGSLNHPGIATLYEGGEHLDPSSGKTWPYYSMERIHGRRIDQHVAEDRLTPGEVILLVLRLCEALGYAHEHGIIHRDLKPSNIMVRRGGEPVVLDFGLAHCTRVRPVSPHAEGDRVSGTPIYMSPERLAGASGADSEQLADTYAIGIILFELLAGRLPFQLPPDPSMADIRRTVLEGKRLSLAEWNPACRGRIEAAVSHLIDVDPAQRPQDINVLAHELRTLIREQVPSLASFANSGTWRPAAGREIPGTSWQLVRKLGEGRIGEVWLARSLDSGEPQVFKFCFDERYVRTLRRELSLFRLLEERLPASACIVRLNSVSSERPPFYLRMDHVDGVDLPTWCGNQGGPGEVPEGLLLEIVAKVAEALHAAHGAGIIHRDVKPSNILVKGVANEVPEVWLTDFGIGQILSDELAESVGPGFTRTVLPERGESLSGTLMYMAPERVAGRAASVQSDVFSLGVTLYQLLIADFSRPLTPGWADRVPDPLLMDDLRRCLADEPGDRFVNAGELVSHLRSLGSRREAWKREQASLAQREKLIRRNRFLAILAGVTALIVIVLSLVLLAVYQARHSRELSAEAAFSKALEGQSGIVAGRRSRSLEDLRRSAELNPERAELADAIVASLILRDLTPLPVPPAPPRITATATATSPAMGRVAWGGQSGEVYLTEESGVWRRLSPPWSAPVEWMVFDPGERFLAVGHGGRQAGLPNLMIWDLVEGTSRVAAEVRGRAFDFSPVEDLMAVGREDGSTRILDLHGGHDPVTLTPEKPPHLGKPWRIRFHPRLPVVAVANEGSKLVCLYRWEGDTRQGALVHSLFHSAAVTAMAWSLDGAALLTSAENGNLHRWLDWESAIEPASVVPSGGVPSGLVFCGDTGLVALQQRDGTLWLRSLVDDRGGVKEFVEDGAIARISASAEGRFLAADTFNGTPLRWRIDAGLEYREFADTEIDWGDLESVAFHPTGNLVAASSRRGVVLRDSFAGTPHILEIATVRSAWFHPVRGDLLASSSHGPHRLAWDHAGPEAESWRLGPTVNLPLPDQLGVSACSADGSTLAFHHLDHVHLVDGASLAEEGMLRTGLTNDVERIALSAGGDWLAARQAGDPFVHVWDLQRQRLTTRVEGSGSFVFEPAGQGLLIGHGGRVLRLDLAKGGVVEEWQPGEEYRSRSFNGPMCFSPDGSILALVHDNFRITLFDYSSGKKLVTLREPRERGHRLLLFDAAGARLATVTDDRRLNLWNLSLIGEQLREFLPASRFASIMPPPAEAPPGFRLAVVRGDGFKSVVNGYATRVEALSGMMERDPSLDRKRWYERAALTQSLLPHLPAMQANRLTGRIIQDFQAFLGPLEPGRVLTREEQYAACALAHLLVTGPEEWRDVPAAEALCRQVLNGTEPDCRQRAGYTLGIANFVEQDYAAAVEAFEAADRIREIRQDPPRISSLIYRAISLANLGRMEPAADLGRQVVEARESIRASGKESQSERDFLDPLQAQLDALLDPLPLRE